MTTKGGVLFLSLFKKDPFGNKYLRQRGDRSAKSHLNRATLGANDFSGNSADFTGFVWSPPSRPEAAFEACLNRKRSLEAVPTPIPLEIPARMQGVEKWELFFKFINETWFELIRAWSPGAVSAFYDRNCRQGRRRLFTSDPKILGDKP